MDLTPGRRLARSLRLRFAESAKSKGQMAFAANPVQTLSSWQQALWIDIGLEHSAKRLLTESQAAAVWRETIEAAVPAELVDALYDAFCLAQAWRLDANTLRQHASLEEHKVLHRCVSRYQNKLAEANWLDPATLGEALADLTVPDGALPAEIRLHGFIGVTPSQQYFFDWLNACGTRVQFIEAGRSAASPTASLYADPDSEAVGVGECIALWLQEDPAQKIGIVSLYAESDRRRHAERILEALDPSWHLSGNRDLIDVAVAPQLISYPLAASLARVIATLRGSMSFAELSPVLRDPLVVQSDSAAAARLERHIRDLPEQSWTIEELSTLQKRLHPDARALHVVERLSTAVAELSEFSEHAPPSLWAGKIDQLLQRLYLDLAAPVSSDVWQLRQAIQGAINAVGELDGVCSSMSGSQALAHFLRQLRTTRYQPEAASGAIPMLGLLGVPGEAFDRLIVMGVDADRWPPRTQANPFIPFVLQRRLQMPGSDPNADSAFAKRLASTLRGSANKLHLTRAESVNGLATRFAPTLAPDDQQTARLGTRPTLAQRSCRSIRVVSEPEPWVGTLMNRQARGGAQLIRLMRQNPFIAYCHYRLAAEPVAAPVIGLGPRLRGVALHRVAEILYGDASKEERLAGRDDIAAAIQLGFMPFRRPDDAPFTRLLQFEQDRAHRLFERLIALDADRDPFSIHALETDLSIVVGGLSLNLRVDRVDKTADGVWVIDYKTGAPSASFIERDTGLPRDLQLGLYACAWTQSGNLALAGLAIAELNTKAPRYLALPFDEAIAIAPSRNRAESSQLPNWLSLFDQLGRDFIQGSSALSPGVAAIDLLPYSSVFGPTEHLSDD